MLENVLSTNKNGLLAEGSGTSYSSPIMVSSYAYVLGILKARAGPQADQVGLQQMALDIMCSTSVKVSALASVCGRISLEAAVAKALAVVF
jgi:hypothetical protein